MALDQVKPWEKDKCPPKTFNLPRWIGARAVPLDVSEVPIWGINPHHKAKNPGLSPFIELDQDDPRGRTNSATLELAGETDRPILTRVYPGKYMPPMPWMQSVDRAPDGLDECLKYWDTHAFVLRTHDIGPASPAPEWYTPPNTLA